MIPQITAIGGSVSDLTIQPYPSMTYKFFDTQIIGFVDGLAAIRQTVLHILSTERYAYEIYDDNYGVELEQCIGKSFEYIKTVIGDILHSALLQDDRIIDVKILNIEQIASNKCSVQFTVFSKLGDFNEELDFDA